MDASIHTARRARLAAVVGQVGVQRLDGHFAPDERVDGAVHRAHRAPPDLLEQLITAESLAHLAPLAGIIPVARCGRLRYVRAMQEFVIRGAKVLDGSGREGAVADVAVRAGKIAAVGTKAGEGMRSIDAGGLALMPGIVDVHAHGAQRCPHLRLLPGSAGRPRCPTAMATT